MLKRLKKFVLFIMMFACITAIPVDSSAAVSPTRINLSKSEVFMKPGKEMSIRAKNRADIRVFFKPKNATSDILVKADNSKVLRVKKTDKYSYTMRALKKGKAKVTVFSKYNPELKKSFTVIVNKTGKPVTQKETIPTEERPELRVADYILTQSDPDWEHPNRSDKQVMGLNTKDMKLYVRLEDANGKKMESQMQKGFQFRSSDENVFRMKGSTVVPVSIGEAKIIISYEWKGREYEFVPVTLRIGDYARPVSLILNSDTAVVTSKGRDESIKVKAIYDQYGHLMSLDGAEWSFWYPDYEVVPKISASGDTLIIEGNGAYPTIYTIDLEVTVFGITVNKNLDVVVRP